MRKFFAFVLFLATGLLQSCSVAWAQVNITGVGVAPSQNVPLGAQNVPLGGVSVSAGQDGFSFTSLSFEVSKCSPWPGLATPFEVLTLNDGANVYPGVQTKDNGRIVVRFNVSGVLASSETKTYHLRTDLASGPEAYLLEERCSQFALFPSGVVTAQNLNGEFPIELTPITAVRAEPIVSLAPVGATSGRVRTQNDVIAQLTIIPTPGTPARPEPAGNQLFLKELRVVFMGGAMPTSPAVILYDVVDAGGAVIGTGRFSLGTPGTSNVNFVGNGEVHVPPNTPVSLKIRVNSTGFTDVSGRPDTLGIRIENSCDFQWDTTDKNTGGPGLCLEAQGVPPQILIRYQ